MKYFVILIAVMIFSCKESELKKDLKQADSVTIHFYNNSQADSVIKIVHTNSKDAIEKLSSFIDSKEIQDKSCGHDGDIVFLKNNQIIQTVNFYALQKGCRQFYFTKNGKPITTSVSNEAADFLTSLWAGKTYY
jgi:hypothetical protein